MKIKSWPNWGVDEWASGILPAENYECSCPPDFDWTNLSDVEDESVQKILTWCHDFKVLKVPGVEVIFQEELRYIVQSAELTSDNGWGINITVFDVRGQENREFKFRLRKWTRITCSSEERKKGAILDQKFGNMFFCKANKLHTTVSHHCEPTCLVHFNIYIYILRHLHHIYTLSHGTYPRINITIYNVLIYI